MNAGSTGSTPPLRLRLNQELIMPLRARKARHSVLGMLLSNLRMGECHGL
jgi:hypothetical protein